MRSAAQIRAAMVASARWAIAANAGIDYAEVRPMPLEAWKRRDTNPHIRTDCSGSVTCICYAAGAPDPNGRGYDGLGFTGTIAQHLTTHRAGAAQCKPGDLVGYGDLSSTNSHVAMVLEAGDDPLLYSFGGEPGPASVRFSTEVAERRAGGFPVSPITFMQTIPDPPPPRRWTARILQGAHVVHETRPARTYAGAWTRVLHWRARHLRAWRLVTHVGYDRPGP